MKRKYVKIILSCFVCALCLGVLVRMDTMALSGKAQTFFKETVAPVLHVESVDSRLRDLFVPVLADKLKAKFPELNVTISECHCQTAKFFV